jgi:uncharacterized protein (DUF983 family)
MTKSGMKKSMIARALRLRCPLCGEGRMFSRWVHMHDYCSNCGLRFDRNESDFFIGAYTINLIVAELIVVAGLVLVILATWPAVPWTGLTWGLVAALVPAPLLTYPFSKSIWLAIDLSFQPPIASEFKDGAPTAPVDVRPSR